jgi:hypothetical protein
MGGAPQIQAPTAPDAGQEFQSALQAYVQGAPALYQEEALYQPRYNALERTMNLSNIQAYANQYFGMIPQATQVANAAQTAASQSALGNLQNLGPAAYQATMASNPAYAQLQAVASQNLAATADPTLQGILGQVQAALPGQVQGFANLGAQVGRDVSGVTSQLQNLYGQVGADTTVADLANLRNQVAANTRSPYFTQTAGTVMGQLGQLDPLTQQLSQSAQEQLALGSNLSPAEIADAAQQARAAYSSRGMLMSNPSMVAEVLNRYNVGQARLQQREQFASGVSGLVQTEQQQRLANALGVTSTDIAATQANQQLAGQMTQAIAGINQANVGLQSGLQGQIASALAQARSQQAGLQGQAVSAFQAGTQQAAGLQSSILDQLYRQQQAGTSGLQYLSGVSQANLAAILGQQNLGANYAQMGQASNAYGTGGPDLFQSSGLLSLVNQNAMARMNAQGQANMVNAQSSGAASGAMIGAGGALLGSLAVGAVAL